MPERQYDYIIVGGGGAGCVLAYRLSENPDNRVLLLEAGGRDDSFFVHMPKGLAKVMHNPANMWIQTSDAEDANAQKPETWIRGRMLGGSTSVNGMMYVRGQPADFDSIADIAGENWSWERIGKAYSELESHELGAAETRGATGPLKVTMPTLSDTLSRAMMSAGEAMGWSVKKDVNSPDDAEAIGYAPRTVYRGRRQSAAVAFLRPALKRKNLTIVTNAVADKVVFDGDRAIGVEVVHEGKRERYSAREIVLCGGALSTPGILERSGIGDPEVLEPLGIPVKRAIPAVGNNLLEHRAIIMQWKLKRDVSHNKLYSGWRVGRSVLQYLLTRSGPMSNAAYEMGAWFRSRPGLNRPDCQFLLSPFSFDFAKDRKAVEKFPGMHITIYPLRPTSVGSIHITSTDPETCGRLITNYRATEADRLSMIGAVRTAREFVRQAPLKSLIECETLPGPDYATDNDILKAYDKFGTCAYHAVGTCRMGMDEGSVVDGNLKVRGVEGLRIIDTSVIPVIPAGNTQGPVFAMAWRAADIILADQHLQSTQRDAA